MQTCNSKERCEYSQGRENKMDRQRDVRAAECNSFNPVACVVCRDQDTVKRVRREREQANTNRVSALSVSQCVKMDSGTPQGLPIESCKNSSPLFLFFNTLLSNPLISLSHPHPSFILSSVSPLPSSSLSFLIFHSLLLSLLHVQTQAFLACKPHARTSRASV